MKHFVFLAVVLALTGLADPAHAGSKLFVGGLSWGTTSEQVERHVAPFGTVTSVVIVATDENGYRSAEATIAFDEPEAAQRAAFALDGRIVDGSPISAKPKEIVVVGSKIKEVVREAGLRTDDALVEALSDQVHEILAAAVDRAKTNGRKTVRPYDL